MRPPDYKLYDQDDQSITLSQLSKRHVALYLCYDSNSMRRVSDLHEQCIANKQDLVFVVVCLYHLRPKKESNLAGFNDALQRFDSCSKSWFLFPHDVKVSRRLWRSFGMAYLKDRLIIIPPNCNSGELEGFAFLKYLHHAFMGYPFTRSSAAEARVEYMRSLNPTSLFQGTDDKTTCLYKLDHDGKSSRRVSHSELEGKRLLLYLGWPNPYSDEVRSCDLLLYYYSDLVDKGWEVVFIPMIDVNTAAVDLRKAAETDRVLPQHIRFVNQMPWPLMSETDSFKTNALKQLNFGQYDENTHIIAVREDGKILSAQALWRIEEEGVTDSLLSDEYLYEDLCDQLQPIDAANYDY